MPRARAQLRGMLDLGMQSQGNGVTLLQRGDRGECRNEEASYILMYANVAELADAQDLGSCPVRGAGSTPAVRIHL
jgi:hypothetical protein